MNYHQIAACHTDYLADTIAVPPKLILYTPGDYCVTQQRIYRKHHLVTGQITDDQNPDRPETVYFPLVRD